MICRWGKFVIFHLIGGLARVVETFLVSSPEEQQAGATVLQVTIS